MLRHFLPITLLGALLASMEPESVLADGFTHHVPYGTPVRLRVDANLSSRNLTGGDLVPMRVEDNVVVDGYVVIAAGAPAVAEVEESDPAVPGGIEGDLMLTAVWARAIDHSRIGIVGYLTGIGRARDITNAGVALLSGAGVADAVGAYRVGLGLGSLGVAAEGIGSSEKGGEAYLTPRMRMNTEVQNLWGVDIDSSVAAGPTDDSPIK
jgi:hypothetical protein